MNCLYTDFTFSPLHIFFYRVLCCSYDYFFFNQCYYCYHLCCSCSTGALENEVKTATAFPKCQTGNICCNIALIGSKNCGKLSFILKWVTLFIYKFLIALLRVCSDFCSHLVFSHRSWLWVSPFKSAQDPKKWTDWLFFVVDDSLPFFRLWLWLRLQLFFVYVTWMFILWLCNYPALLKFTLR